MFSLSLTQRIAIVGASIGLLGVVVLVTLCFICPYCWIYKRLRSQTPSGTSLISRNRKIASASPMVAMPSYRGVHKTLNMHTLTYSDPPPPYEHSVFHHPMELVRLNSASSNNSENGIPLPRTNEMDTEFAGRYHSETLDQACGSVTLSFQYWPKARPEDIGQLKITLKEANDLPYRPYGSKCDAYIIAQISKAIKRKHRIKKAKEDLVISRHETIVRRKCQNPVFNENFSTHLDYEDLPLCTFMAVVWDKEKLANDSAIGETILNLKEIMFDLRKNPIEECDFQLYLKEPKLSNGEILLGLCYLPTAERMTVAILKVNNLKQDAKQREGNLETYVQALALYSGKVMEKRKTSSRPYITAPVFNEMLMFDIPSSKIESIVLMVSVRNKMPASYDAIKCNSDTSIFQRRDTCMGKVLIGSSCKKRELQHWNAMKSSPRKQIVQWHILR